MTAAKHSAPRDPSFRRSLLRNVGGAVGLVVLVAAIFGVLGMIGRADPEVPPIADGPEEPAEVPPDAEDEEEAPPEDEAPPAGDPAEQPPAETPSEEAPTEDPGDVAEEPADEAEEPAEPAPPAETTEPSTISVQVLDGYREDGGTAADQVYQQLEDAGYRIVARNPAIAYDVTTVLWTPGHEDEGRQVAREIGATEIREQPGNLSSEVNVHVVVGADRG